MTGVRLYESDVDGDGLGCYRMRAGHMDQASDWYGRFWRLYWYDAFTSDASAISMEAPPPDFADQALLFRRLDPLITRLVKRTADLVRFTKRNPLPIETLKSAQAEVAEGASAGPRHDDAVTGVWADDCCTAARIAERRWNGAVP